MIVSSSSKCLSLISSFFICVSTNKATKPLILRSSTAAKCFALTAAADKAAAAAVDTTAAGSSSLGLSSVVATALPSLSLSLSLLSPSFFDVVLSLSSDFFSSFFFSSVFCSPSFSSFFSCLSSGLFASLSLLSVSIGSSPFFASSSCFSFLASAISSWMFSVPAMPLFSRPYVGSTAPPSLLALSTVLV